MRKLIMAIFVLGFFSARSQLIVNLQLPPQGLVQKPQLWNMLVTNTSGSSITMHLEMVLSDVHSGQQVLSGSTGSFVLNTGTTQLQSSFLGPVQYNILNPSFNIDAGQTGLLPPGFYNVCFNFIRHNADILESIDEECTDVLVEPLSPPVLIQPADHAVMEQLNPVFTWLPPSPVLLFNNLNYHIELVEVYAEQTASDAIEQNLPLYSQENIQTTSIVYPASATALAIDKKYAWRITASSSNSPVTQSETWEFSLKQFQHLDSSKKADLPFAKLSRGEEPGYAIFSGAIKFDYFNETADTVWNLKLTDLSIAGQSEVDMPMDSVKLKRGQNLVLYPVTEMTGIIDRHMYLLEITNSRNERWTLRFEYREPINTNEQ